jgi:Ras-related protein Rab-18
MSKYDHILKFVVIGDSGVGKSAILSRLCTGKFEENMEPTIGIDFYVKTMRMQNQTVKLTIWDTAGQERFRTLTSSYYRNSHGVLLVYDVNNKQSYDNLHDWMNEIDLNVTRQQVSILLIGNKIDLDARQVSFEEAKKYSDAQAIHYRETSAKTDEGIWPSFRELVESVLKTVKNTSNKPSNFVLTSEDSRFVQICC